MSETGIASVPIGRRGAGLRVDRYAWLARYPALGAALVAAGLAVFALLLLNFKTGGFLAPWDALISNALHARATQQDPAWLVLLWRAVAVAGRELIMIAAPLLGLYWLWHRRWRELAMVAMGTGVGEQLFEFLAKTIGRQRPQFPDPIEFLPGPGFPSGHVMSTILFYGMLAYLLLPRLKSRGWRLLALVDVALLALVVGFSRVYIGLHWPTDILAGYAISLAWGAFVYTGVEVNHWLKRKPDENGHRVR